MNMRNKTSIIQTKKVDFMFINHLYDDVNLISFEVIENVNKADNKKRWLTQTPSIKLKCFF